MTLNDHEAGTRDGLLSVCPLDRQQPIRVALSVLATPVAKR